MDNTASKVKGFPKSPIQIPEGKSGTVQINHLSERKFTLVSFRETLMTGRQPQTIALPEPITIHELTESGMRWMTDLPVEVQQMHEAVNRLNPRGNVLIGGLGLGVVAQIIARRKLVKQVDVVEINRDVVALVAPTLPAKCQAIESDIYQYIDHLVDWPYSCALLDTWRDDNEGAWWDDVFPLRRLIANKFGKQKVECWAEDIMLGQIHKSLMMKEVQHWYYRMPNLPMSNREAVWFTRNVGLPEWEDIYGVYYPKATEEDEKL